ncbi:MAG TPA: hypothetical protein VD996_09560 [Chitinophagaceae bacterium]|nr:hypothetical protein [Chitinophagaceae bacterium]
MGNSIPYHVGPGIVIGTYSAVPYVHLQLESARRHYPHVPILVHDDCSSEEAALRSLCNRYGADFQSNAAAFHQRLGRYGHYGLGDLSVFLHGLVWAKEKNVDVLLKLSRRFLLLRDVSLELQEIACNNPSPLIGAHYKDHPKTARTNCIALNVPHWNADVICSMEKLIREKLQNRKQGLYVEAVLHKLARQAADNGCAPLALWQFALLDQKKPQPGQFMWHEAHSVHQYAIQAKEWGLPFEAADFENMKN